MSTLITLDEIRTWPSTVDVPTAGRAIGISRSHSFELVKRGEFPCRTIRIGSRYRVPTSAILALLEGADAREKP
jgi:predicted DNA-binding transcriptional regulator AlpA